MLAPTTNSLKNIESVKISNARKKMGIKCNITKDRYMQ